MKIALVIVYGRKGHRTNDGEPRKYHLWKNGDTECKMHKSGGLGDVKNIKLDLTQVTEYRFKQMRKNGEICANCVSDSKKLDNNKKKITDNNKKKINSIEPKEFLWVELYEGGEWVE